MFGRKLINKLDKQVQELSEAVQKMQLEAQLDYEGRFKIEAVSDSKGEISHYLVHRRYTEYKYNDDCKSRTYRIASTSEKAHTKKDAVEMMDKWRRNRVTSYSGWLN